MRLPYSSICAFVIVGSIAGFPLVAAVSAALGISSTGISVVMRGLILLGAMLLLAGPSGNSKISGRHTAVVLLLVFWIMYIARIADATLREADILSRPIMYYWSFALGACFIPMLALATTRKLPDGDRLIVWTLAFSVAALLLSLSFADSTVGSGNEIYDSGRLALDSLNPISLGQLGVTVSLVSYAMWMRGWRGFWWPVLGATFALGLYSTLHASSRGPAVAMIIALAITQIARGRSWVLAGVSVFIILAVFILGANPGAIDSAFGTTIFARFEAAAGGDDLSAALRIQSYDGAWSQFISSPFIGDGLEERTTGFYPHNIVLEALMATGIVGGLLMCLGLVILLKQSIRLLRERSANSWIGLAFIQYLIAAQFSGALWNVNTLWSLAGVMAALTAAHQRSLRISYDLRLSASDAK